MTSKAAEIIALALAAAMAAGLAKEADDPTSTPLPNGDLLIGDFEHRDQGRMRAWGWQFEGNAFGGDFRAGTSLMRARVGRHRGEAFVSTMAAGPDATGALTSPPFIIERPAIQFLLSGGSRAGELSANLLIEGSIVRAASGRDDDLLESVAFDVAEFAGREARFQVVDRAGGIWGHINVDHIVQTGTPRASRVVSTPPPPVDRSIGFLHPLSGAPVTGPFQIRDGMLVGSEEPALALEETLLLATGAEASGPGATDALVLSNGERWIGRVSGLEDGKVSVQGGVLNNRQVPLAGVARIEFNINKPDTGPASVPRSEAGTLYRSGGEPIPGTLVWIRDKDVAIDCALGVVPVPRDTLRSYVVSVATARARGDEVELRDGSRLRGRLRLEGDRLVLEHAVLGELRFGIDALQRLRRNPQNLVWLSRRRPAAFDSSGALMPPPKPGRISPASAERWYGALRIHPRSTITYKVPRLGAGEHRLRAVLGPGRGNRGRVSFCFIDGDEVEKHVLAPGSEPGVLDVPVSAGGVFKLEIGFEGRLLFPCAVDLRDAHIIAPAEPGAEPGPETRTGADLN